ncbi:GNAT family N-acetyltransferase [Bacillus sp. 03113]|uniref:GNAT family N-acetyltransferase n=1 Tax=Bacillus sp. 03113 TaxID=2578211 RepID=UPI001143F473|nr:GNAT family protein [Bacillus sp. 03113]
MLDIKTFESKIKIDFYRPEHKLLLKNYFLPLEQVQYTSLPLAAIADCEADNDRYPFVILINDEIAGFFILHGWEGVKEYYHNRKAILLRAYSINTLFQGKGIATKSLKLLPSFVREHFPDKNEIILAVNARNKAAQHVYQKCGFIDKGIRAMGKKGEMFIYHLEL